jgi:hypothetical protein
VFVEDWAASYGSPYLIVPDGAETIGVLVEDGAAMIAHSPAAAAALLEPIAFVDGVRRGDASLYQADTTTGLLARGIAGSHGCGAVIINPGEREGCNLAVAASIKRLAGRRSEPVPTKSPVARSSRRGTARETRGLSWGGGCGSVSASTVISAGLG